MKYHSVRDKLQSHGLQGKMPCRQIDRRGRVLRSEVDDAIVTVLHASRICRLVDAGDAYGEQETWRRSGSPFLSISDRLNIIRMGARMIMITSCANSILRRSHTGTITSTPPPAVSKN